MPTGEEIRDAFKKTALWLNKNKHMFEKEREHDAIEAIKCKGNHIGTYEARAILEALRVVLGAEKPNAD